MYPISYLRLIHCNVGAQSKSYEFTVCCGFASGKFSWSECYKI